MVGNWLVEASGGEWAMAPGFAARAWRRDWKAMRGVLCCGVDEKGVDGWIVGQFHLSGILNEQADG